MSEQPTATAGSGRPGQRGQGKKILGLPRGQAIGLGAVAAGGLIYLIWRARKNAKTASASATSGSCPDGSTPDANGNCPQSSQDYSGQIATLESEIAQLQGELSNGGGAGAGGSGGGWGGYGGASGTGAGSVGGSTGTTTAPPTPASPITTTSPVYPMNQTGVVTSATTGRQGKVTSSDGGKTWNYNGAKPSANEPKNQTGTVYSSTTQRSGKVSTSNAGETWTYVGVPSSS